MKSITLQLAAVAVSLHGLASAQITFPVTTQTSFPSPQCTQGPSATEKFTINYNFESVERGFALSPLTQIGIYNLLSFTGINIVNTDPDLDGNHLGSAPHTYPFFAAFAPGTVLVDSLLDASPNNRSLITTHYIESTISSFTPQSFWYGCVLPSPISAGSLPTDCNITATGFDGAGRLIARQEFGFRANGSVVQDQLYATFEKGFEQVSTVAFGVAPLQAAAVMDNFIATLEQRECAPYYTGSYGNGT